MRRDRAPRVTSRSRTGLSLTAILSAAHESKKSVRLLRQWKPKCDRYEFATSTDGTHWTTQLASGEFGNIRNNPMLQEVRFAPVDARIFRFTPLHDVESSDWVGAAEITVLPAATSDKR